MDKKIRAISPLALLGLAACNGDDAASVFGGTSSGLAVKGPLANALAFVDTNGNGELDDGEISTRTSDGSDGSAVGSYSLANPDAAQIVIITDDQTVDSSSGAVLSGIKMIGAADAGVITPLSGIDADDIDTSALATALGLEGVDLLSFNPYADGVDAETALGAEKVSQQIVGSLQIISGALVGTGLSATTADGYTAAFNALADAAQAYIDAGEDIEFADTTFLAELLEAAGLEVGAGSPSLTQAQLDDIAAQLAELNGLIDAVTDLESDDASEAFSAASVVADAYEDDIDVANALDVAVVAANAAPTDITLTPADDLSIDETVEGETGDVLVGALAASDDTTAAEKITFELVGDNAELFDIVDGNVVLRDDAEVDFETTETLTVSVKATDADGKSTAKTFEVAVNNIAESHTQGEVEISGDHNPGDTLTIEDTLVDEDNGTDTSDFASKTYQWFADGEAIVGETGATLELTDEHLGSEISASVTVVDQLGEETAFDTTYGNVLPDFNNGDVPVVVRVTDLFFDAGEELGEAANSFGDNIETFFDNAGEFLAGFEDDLSFGDTMVSFDSDGELQIDFGTLVDDGEGGEDFIGSGNWLDIEFSSLNVTTLAEFEALLESIDLEDPSTWSVAGQIDKVEFGNEAGAFNIILNEADGADDSDEIKFRYRDKDENGDFIEDPEDIRQVILKGDFDTGLESIIEIVDAAMAWEDIPEPDFNDFYDPETGIFDWEANDAAWADYNDAVDQADFEAFQTLVSIEQLEGLSVVHHVDEDGDYYSPFGINLFHEQSDGDTGAFIRLDDYTFYIQGEFPESILEFSILLDPSIGLMNTLDTLWEDDELSADDIDVLLNGTDELVGLADGGITDLQSIGLYKYNEATDNHDTVVSFEIADFAELIEIADDIDTDEEIDGTFVEVDDDGEVTGEYSYVYDTDGMYIVLGEGLDLDTLYDALDDLALDEALLAA